MVVPGWKWAFMFNNFKRKWVVWKRFSESPRGFVVIVNMENGMGNGSVDILWELENCSCHIIFYSKIKLNFLYHLFISTKRFHYKVI